MDFESARRSAAVAVDAPMSTLVSTGAGSGVAGVSCGQGSFHFTPAEGASATSVPVSSFQKSPLKNRHERRRQKALARAR